jgi:peptidoglycan/xylan/chitin deacetylase (PgdA/CDA1 family)
MTRLWPLPVGVPAVPALVAAVGTVVAVQAAPSLTKRRSLRIRVFPRLAGFGDPGHIALTFDDGPDPAVTPRFLDVLAARGVRCTFFLLGAMLARAPGLGRDLVAAGHEVAVHGWTHRNLLLAHPRSAYQDLARTRGLIAETTGQVPRFFRPPFGLLSGTALLAARRLDLRPVLWSCWGKEWTRPRTPQSVLDALHGDLAGGGTVLLHDSGCELEPDAWMSTLAALPRLLDDCAERGLRVGPLGAHGTRATA